MTAAGRVKRRCVVKREKQARLSISITEDGEESDPTDQESDDSRRHGRGKRRSTSDAAQPAAKRQRTASHVEPPKVENHNFLFTTSLANLAAELATDSLFDTMSAFHRRIQRQPTFLQIKLPQSALAAKQQAVEQRAHQQRQQQHQQQQLQQLQRQQQAMQAQQHSLKGVRTFSSPRPRPTVPLREVARTHAMGVLPAHHTQAHSMSHILGQRPHPTAMPPAGSMQWPMSGGASGFPPSYPYPPAQYPYPFGQPNPFDASAAQRFFFQPGMAASPFGQLYGAGGGVASRAATSAGTASTTDAMMDDISRMIHPDQNPAQRSPAMLAGQDTRPHVPGVTSPFAAGPTNLTGDASFTGNQYAFMSQQQHTMHSPGIQPGGQMTSPVAAAGLRMPAMYGQSALLQQQMHQQQMAQQQQQQQQQLAASQHAAAAAGWNALGVGVPSASGVNKSAGAKTGIASMLPGQQKAEAMPAATSPPAAGVGMRMAAWAGPYAVHSQQAQQQAMAAHAGASATMANGLVSPVASQSSPLVSASPRPAMNTALQQQQQLQLQLQQQQHLQQQQQLQQQHIHQQHIQQQHNQSLASQIPHQHHQQTGVLAQQNLLQQQMNTTTQSLQCASPHAPAPAVRSGPLQASTPCRDSSGFDVPPFSTTSTTPVTPAATTSASATTPANDSSLSSQGEGNFLEQLADAATLMSEVDVEAAIGAGQLLVSGDLLAENLQSGESFAEKVSSAGGTQAEKLSSTAKNSPRPAGVKAIKKTDTDKSEQECQHHGELSEKNSSMDGSNSLTSQATLEKKDKEKMSSPKEQQPANSASAEPSTTADIDERPPSESSDNQETCSSNTEFKETDCVSADAAVVDTGSKESADVVENGKETTKNNSDSTTEDMSSANALTSPQPMEAQTNSSPLQTKAEETEPCTTDDSRQVGDTNEVTEAHENCQRTPSKPSSPVATNGASTDSDTVKESMDERKPNASTTPDGLSSNSTPPDDNKDTPLEAPRKGSNGDKPPACGNSEPHETERSESTNAPDTISNSSPPLEERT